MLRRKQCNTINRVAYVCCAGGSDGGSIPITTAQPMTTRAIFNANNVKSRLPKSPDCGVGLNDKVSHEFNLY